MRKKVKGTELTLFYEHSCSKILAACVNKQRMNEREMISRHRKLLQISASACGRYIFAQNFREFCIERLNESRI